MWSIVVASIHAGTKLILLFVWLFTRFECFFGSAEQLQPIKSKRCKNGLQSGAFLKVMVRVGGPTPASELANTYLCHPAGNELTNTPSNSRKMQRHLMAWHLRVHILVTLFSAQETVSSLIQKNIVM